MRWITYFILAYLALAIQVGAGPYLRWEGAPPNLVLLAVIFIALNAPKEAALLGAFSLGLLQDLVTQAPLGLYGLSYGMVGMFVVSTQNLVYREHPLTHLSLAIVGGLLCSSVVFIHGLVHGPRAPAMGLLTATTYTAILSPFVIGALERIKRLFAFQPTRRKIRA